MALRPVDGPSAVALAPTPGLPAEPPRGQPGHHVLRSEHPAVELSCSSALFTDRPKPDVLKLRKRVTAWPLEFTFKADYHTATRDFTYGLMCRDALIKGHITLNMPQQQVEYHKCVPLGGAVGHGAALALSASCRLEDQRLKPDFKLSVEFGTHSSTSDSSNAVFVGGAGGGSFDVQQRFKIAKGLAVEVCGNVQLPSPAARYSPSSGQLVLGEGGLHMHVAQVNAVVHI